VVVDKPFTNFFQHLFSVCPNPKQNEHFRPQFSFVCPPPHLAHFGFVSASLGRAKIVCSSKLQYWQRLLMVVEKVILGPTLPLVPFPKKLMRVSFKTWSCWCRFNFLNHSLALPLRFNLVILNNLSAFKFQTFVAIVNLSAQSFTSS